MTRRAARIGRDPRGAKPHPIRTASPVLRGLLELADLYGVSHSELASHTNCAPNSFSAWRAGRTTPTIMTTEAIADALGYRLEIVRNDK